MPNKEKITLPNGTIIERVGKQRYMQAERIRNYVYRGHYERNVPIWLGVERAKALFDVSDTVIFDALYRFCSWYYGPGIRHRPIEAFIKDAST